MTSYEESRSDEQESGDDINKHTDMDYNPNLRFELSANYEASMEKKGNGDEAADVSTLVEETSEKLPVLTVSVACLKKNLVHTFCWIVKGCL